MRVPSPPNPTGNPQLDIWISAITDIVDGLTKARQGQLLTVGYDKLTSVNVTLRRTPGFMVYCPDHPDGPSILLATPTEWQVFTASGTL